MDQINNKVELFLDSGAFSAWTQGVEINIQDYINFIKENLNVIEVYANLDVIGNAKNTWANQITMEKAGLNPVPIFHYGESIKWLQRILNKNYNYIGLGGMVGVKNDQLIKWLDPLFSNYLTDNKGIPIVKVHGFGLTSLKLLLRYPWYSVDSTSWVVTGRLGSIYIPRNKNGEWIYDENPWKIAVSNRSPSKKEAGQHINTLPPIVKELFLSYIKQKGYCLGKSEYKQVEQNYKLKDNERWEDPKPKSKSIKREVEIIIEPGISNKYQLRDELNIIYFMDLEKSMPEWPWEFKDRRKSKPFNFEV